MVRLLGAGAAPLLGLRFAKAAQLPLSTTGLEHIGMTVPDQDAASKYYGRIFDPQLFQEKDPPPRFYVKVGISYIAFGGRPEVMPSIDHFCALVENYQAQEMRKTLEESGIPVAGRGPLGMPADPDGLRLQLLGVPGGLARTIIPASRISQDEPAVQAIGFDHIVLTVSDMEKSAAYYKKFFGEEMSRSKKPERIWFKVANTRLGLEPVGAGKKPSIDRIGVKIAGFDRKAVTARLQKLNVEVVPSDEKDAVRFRDLNGLVMELKAGV
jgi:catechol 2,3-dioxygenase-like lactoylglutathione lyase family enzyme